MLPVMIGALVAALEGFSLLPFLYAGFPAALLLALLWVRFRMQATLAEICIDRGRAAVQTVWDLIRKTGGPAWHPVLDVRRDAAGFTLTLGLDVYELKLQDWPEGERLIDELRQARTLGERSLP